MTVQQYIFEHMLLCSPVTLAAPTVSGRDSSMWTFTSHDGSRVERYFVQFECRVQNIIFVEKYMSVSASGGTGLVATSASCFGGLGQFYRVKVWAVSGPNISRQPVVKCLKQDRQCMIKGGSTYTMISTVCIKKCIKTGEYRYSLRCVQLPAVHQL